MSDGPSSQGGEKKPLIDYPTVYAFKVMGRLEHGFSEWVRLLFSRMMGAEVSRDSISESVSNKGNYVSVTISVYLLSEDHRRTIYEALHKEKRILYYL